MSWIRTSWHLCLDIYDHVPAEVATTERDGQGGDLSWRPWWPPRGRQVQLPVQRQQHEQLLAIVLPLPADKIQRRDARRRLDSKRISAGQPLLQGWQFIYRLILGLLVLFFAHSDMTHILGFHRPLRVVPPTASPQPPSYTARTPYFPSHFFPEKMHHYWQYYYPRLPGP